MSMSKNDRALLVLRHIATGESENLEWLYEFSEFAAMTVVNAELTPKYSRIIKLEGAQATENNFIQKLSELGANEAIKAIDVIVILHGSADKLSFYEGKVPVARLKYKLSCLNVRRQLRLLYSTACYGATHADDFVAAGFDAASGALGVNANGAIEFPIVADALADGSTHKKGIQDGSLGLEQQDAIAKTLGFEDANSTKRIVGNGEITINSSPTFSGKAYFFKGDQYIRWDLKIDTIDSGYPHSAASQWSQLSPKIDAAVIWPNDKVYFFKGNQYIRWDLKTDAADEGYPKPTSSWHSFMSNGIDAAVNWPNGKVYFFKGDQYIRWDVAADKIDDDYPQKIALRWPSFMANGVDAAINWGNGKAYFFKGDEYIRWDMAAGKIDDGYPQKIALRWPSFMANGVDAAFLWLRSS